jgi:hypothetical protein
LDVVAMPLQGADRTLRKLVTGPPTANYYNGVVSPIGQWLAYVMSDTAGAGQIFIRPYPNVKGDRWPVSPVLANDVVWARSGREVFFISTAGKLLAVTVQPGPVLGGAVELFDNGPYVASSQSGIDYDTTPDGRFLMIKRRLQDSETAPAQMLIVVTHWTDELRALVK